MSAESARYVSLYRPSSKGFDFISSHFFPTRRSKAYELKSGTADEAPEVCLRVFVEMTASGRVRSGLDEDAWPSISTWTTHFTWAENHRGEVVGVHGYRLDDGLLRSVKTWVHHRHRRKGLMSALWGHSLARWRPTTVAVYCISPVSYAAMKKIARRHSGISWEVTK